MLNEPSNLSYETSGTFFLAFFVALASAASYDALASNV